MGAAGCGAGAAGLLTRNGDGHTAYAGGNDCIDTQVDGYLITRTLPTTTTC